MATLRQGSTGPEVKSLQLSLNKAGYPVGEADGIFGAMTNRAVRALQEDTGLVVDGVVGPKTTKELGRLIAESSVELLGSKDFNWVGTFEEATALPREHPVNMLDHRISSAVYLQQNCDDGQGCRYGGWVNPYMFDKDAFDAGKKFIIPLVGRIVPGHKLTKPIHGGTCSPWAGLMLGWYLCANEDYNFRIGRSAYKIANFDHDEVYKNSTIPGYGDYCEVEGKRRLEKLPLSALYKHWDWLNRVNFVEMDHHCIIILKVGGPDGLNLVDPHGDSDKPLAAGLYRWGADGYYPRKDLDGDGIPEKYYSGTKQSFRRIKETERVGQGWDVYRVADVDLNTCSPVDGPWAGNEPWDLDLE